MGKGLFRNSNLCHLALVFALVSCGVGVDSSFDDGGENAEGASSFSTANALSSAEGLSSSTDPSSYSSQSGSSSSSEVAFSNSSAAASSLSQIPSSSFSRVASAQVIYNTQNCAYTAGSPYGTLVCDEKTYKTVTIGTQTLMAENLNVGAMVLGSADQSNDGVIEKYCYSDTETSCTIDGGLYQWSEAMGLPSSCNSFSCASQIHSDHHQGICPSGWHLPTDEEWDVLVNSLGGNDLAGKTMKLNTTGYASWDDSIYNDGNSSGFSALPVGFRFSLGNWSNRGNYAFFWSASEYNGSVAWFRRLGSNNASVSRSSSGGKTNGFSLRCLRD